MIIVVFDIVAVLPQGKQQQKSSAIILNLNYYRLNFQC